MRLPHASADRLIESRTTDIMMRSTTATAETNPGDGALVTGSSTGGNGPFAPGDWVVFRKTKFSRQPGRRAANIAPAENGDGYAYLVDKFWVVDAILPDNRVRLLTRRGKTHVLKADDLRLRPAGWWEKFVYRQRFAETAQSTAEADSELAVS